MLKGNKAHFKHKIKLTDLYYKVLKLGIVCELLNNKKCLMYNIEDITCEGDLAIFFRANLQHDNYKGPSHSTIIAMSKNNELKYGIGQTKKEALADLTKRLLS